MRIVHVVLASSFALSGFACNKDDDDDDNNTSSSGSSGSSWLVGDDGEMLRLTSEGATRPYVLTTEADLNAIACIGTTAAWVVGSGGTVISTADSGESWQTHDVGTSADFVAVAVDEHGDEPVVVIAGDGALLSKRGDAAFTAVHAGDIDWRGVAVGKGRLLAVASDGSVWRSDGDAALAQVATFDAQTPSALALAATTDVAVVVGAEGFVARTTDGGATWSSVSVPTVRDLWAVRVESDGDEFVAVGDAGVVVRVDESGATAQELLDPALSLRAIHIHGEGEGHTVGDAGTVLVTEDFGATWEPIVVGVDTVLRGVDAIRVHGHW
jgi:photosystem II stability/assembly factor-like uncharacterized protein